MLEGLDVVGMARTGSGKTAAFVIPMIEKLKMHSVKIGARALILSPSRELALQTLKVVKEFGKGTDLKSVLLVGGDSLEDQFGFMTENPDMYVLLTRLQVEYTNCMFCARIIATPGRFLHLQVEMSLSLSSIQYVVFDEADRLFEMGFSSQLTEILHALPSSRQTLLFSATLPKSLVEFAKAGLEDPYLVRLDTESKISEELESAFFSVKSSEKEGALIHILQAVIRISKEDEVIGRSAEQSFDPKRQQRKRKHHSSGGTELSSLSTIIFVATKHHVEYISRLLLLHNYPTSFVYGSLDQTARRQQVENFCSGKTKILVVTDVAARGIDIPIITNVINYDFPPQPKVFVHRVGRTARAGKRGWAYSLVRAEDTPYLLDLQLFLGRKLVYAEEGKKKDDYDFVKDIIVGSLPRDAVGMCVEKINLLLDEDTDLGCLRGVMVKGEKLYQRTKSSASVESIQRAKEVTAQKLWTATHALFRDDVNDLEEERARMLVRVSGFRPSETVFEIGQKGLHRSEAAEVMRRRRGGVRTRKEQDIDADKVDAGGTEAMDTVKTLNTINPDVPDSNNHHNYDPDIDSDDEESSGIDSHPNMSPATEADLASTFLTKYKVNKQLNSSISTKKSACSAPTSFQDPTHFMSYAPHSTSLAEEHAYSITGPSGTSSFALAARNATFDLTTDDGQKGFAEASRAKPQIRWDSKAKKFVSTVNDTDGSRGKRMIVSESGQKIAASFKSGRFENWKKENRVTRLPVIGEQEVPMRIGGPGGRPMGGKRGGRMFHSQNKAPKEADRFRDDYEKRRKRVKEAEEKLGTGVARNDAASGVRNLKTKDQIRKEVKLKSRRKEKNNRPSRKTVQRRPLRPKGAKGKSNKGGGGGSSGGNGKKGTVKVKRGK